MIKKLFYIFAFICIGAEISIAAVTDYSVDANNFKHTKHSHHEASYQNAWCSTHKGILEYKNKDYTRVDCLTATHAVEFDFANKWAESVGQALHYELMTRRRAMVVLILENPKGQMVYYNRVKALAKVHDFDVEYVTPAILNLKNGKCENLTCKCHKKDNSLK